MVKLLFCLYYLDTLLNGKAGNLDTLLNGKAAAWILPILFGHTKAAVLLTLLNCKAAILPILFGHTTQW